MFSLRSILIQVSHLLPPSLRAKVKWSMMIPDMEASLMNLRRLGFRPAVVLDIGAFVGKWTALCKRIWPEAHILMFEPQPAKAQQLKETISGCRDVQLMATLLGEAEEDRVQFHLMESGSSVLPTAAHPDAPTIQLPSTTLAKATTGTEFASPNLIKIDVQGYELKVLKGGLAVLRAAEVVVMEVSLFPTYEGSPVMHEMIDFMVVNGFRPFDICTLWRNTPTRSMDQADVIFAKKSSTLFAARHYQ